MMIAFVRKKMFLFYMWLAAIVSILNKPEYGGEKMKREEGYVPDVREGTIKLCGLCWKILMTLKFNVMFVKSLATLPASRVIKI